MTSKLNTSDEGGCYRWIPLHEDQKLREKGMAVAVRILGIVQSCSEDLNDRERDLLRLHLKGFTPTEIANAWNEDVDEIQVQMNRILAKLRHRCRRKNKKDDDE